MKLVHAADLHLDSALAGLTRYESAPADEIRGATRRAFSNLVSLCLEERVSVLVISGDLFDFFVPEEPSVRLAISRSVFVEQLSVRRSAPAAGACA